MADSSAPAVEPGSSKNGTDGQTDSLALRSAKLMKGPLSYIGVFLKATEDLWSPENREGWIPLVVAENKLGNDAFLDRLKKVDNFPTWIMNYGGFKGTPAFQSALCGLMSRTFVKPPAVLTPSNLCVLSGCTGVLENLFYCLGNPGSSVLIPAPYYPAFDNDLEAKADLRPTPFTLPDDAAAVGAALDAQRDAATAENRPVVALLVTNPNNPLGTIYSDEVVTAMMAWCLSNKVHYISDEVYALSVFKKGETTPKDTKECSFTSALTLAARKVATSNGSDDTGAVFTSELVDRYIHLIYGLSKDWCASGLRVGALYSANAPLQQAMMTLAGFSGVSLFAQHALAEVLSDEAFTSEFIATNTAALEKSYDALAKALDDAGIPYVKPTAGMFVWIDLRESLPKPTWEGEAALWRQICDTCKVILTPGKDCHASEPGYFRLCFAWVTQEALVEAVTRIQNALGGMACTIS